MRGHDRIGECNCILRLLNSLQVRVLLSSYFALLIYVCIFTEWQKRKYLELKRFEKS